MLNQRWLTPAALLLAVTLTGCGINNIPTYDESVNARWSDVQNQYKRRADLIPNLIETVKGFASQEADVLQQVTEARTKVTQTNVSPEILSDEAMFQQFQQNQNALSGALSKMNAGQAPSQVVGGISSCTPKCAQKRPSPLTLKILKPRPWISILTTRADRCACSARGSLCYWLPGRVSPRQHRAFQA